MWFTLEAGVISASKKTFPFFLQHCHPELVEGQIMLTLNLSKGLRQAQTNNDFKVLSLNTQFTTKTSTAIIRFYTVMVNENCIETAISKNGTS